MKKLLFTIIIFMLAVGLAHANEYEVTIHVVYNSIPPSEVAELIESQLRKHKDACKVEIKITNPDETGSVNVIYTDAASSITLTDDDINIQSWSN